MKRIARELWRQLGGIWTDWGAKALERLDQEWPRRFATRSFDDSLISADDAGWAEAFASEASHDLQLSLSEAEPIRHRSEEALQARTEAVADALGAGSFEKRIYNRVAADYARRNSYELGVRAIADTNRRLLGGVIAEAIASGRTYDDVRGDVTEFFDDLADWEAYRIASSEIGNAARQGNLLATQATANEYGIGIARAVLIPATDACDTICKPLAQRTEEGNFTLEEAMAFSGELHPHCRCDWGYEFQDDDEVAASQRRRRWLQ